MTPIDRIAIEAALRIDDLFAQAHDSRVQRTARVHSVVADAIRAAITPPASCFDGPRDWQAESRRAACGDC